MLTGGGFGRPPLLDQDKFPSASTDGMKITSLGVGGPSRKLIPMSKLWTNSIMSKQSQLSSMKK